MGGFAHDGLYWGGYAESFAAKYDYVEKDPAVTFGDYGAKDIYMWVAAAEVYKWLCNSFSTNMVGKGIHIEFQSLFASKSGPSAGATMAVSAYSSLFNKPILKNVAMTGEITADGAVHAVGGIYEKLTAASLGEGIEIVVVPKENEPDLLFVPLDTLCRIVESSDISTYLSVATDPDAYKYEMEYLRKAQLLLRLGKYKEAEEFLLKVVAVNPDIYSAKRLLELLNCYSQSKSDKGGT